MCGRYSIITKNRESKGAVRAARLLQQAEVDNRFNVAPSQHLPVITNEAPEELQFLSWGLLPPWAKERNYKHKSINARAETLAEKPMFRKLVDQRRCLVPADSFYEWRRISPRGKAPYRFQLKDEGLFCFAGLWDEWADRETGEVIRSYTLITTEPNELMRPIHDRMPVLLHPEEEAQWLSSEGASEQILFLLNPYPSEEMKCYAVSPLVNSPANDSPEVLEPAPEQGNLFG